MDRLTGVGELFPFVVHPHTSEVYDITHKAARLLKSQLESDEAWSRFCQQAGQTKLQTQQTELAFLVPPSQRSQARYMNLGPIVNWGRRTLKILQSPSADVLKWCSRERLEEKFGWLRDYCEPLDRWSGWLESTFGKPKSLERSATKSGFTSLLLGLGAVVGKTTAEMVHSALESCSTKNVHTWCREHLDTTLQSKRRRASAQDKNQDETLPPST